MLNSSQELLNYLRKKASFGRVTLDRQNTLNERGMQLPSGGGKRNITSKKNKPTLRNINTIFFCYFMNGKDEKPSASETESKQ